MFSWLMLILAGFLLVGATALGWLRWARPYGRALEAAARNMLALAILVVVGGLIGSVFWWMDERQSFAWRLAPLASRMLASAGLGFAAAGIYALERGRTRLVHGYLIMLAVYLAPLAAAIALFHLHRFDWRAPITYAFFAIVGLLTIGAFWHLARGTRLPSRSGRQAEPHPTPPGARLALGLVALVSGLWGLALFIWPDGPYSLIWIWRWDGLTSRLIAVMLLTLATGALLGLRDIESAAMAAWLFLVYGIGVVLACFLATIVGRSAPPAYEGAFSVLALLAAFLLLTMQSTSGGKPLA